MESATRNTKSYATVMFIVGVAAALISVYAIGGNHVWLSYACILLFLCLLIGLYFVATNLQKQTMELSATNEGLNKRLSQFQSQVGRKEEATIETRKIIGVDEFIAKIIPSKEQEFESLEKFSERILTAIAKELNAAQGLFFIKEAETFKLQGRYAYFSEVLPRDFAEGEGLSGQVAKDQTVLNITDIPADYITIVSGLGSGQPRSVMIIPAIHNGASIGVIELASFQNFSEEEVKLLSQITSQLGESIVNYSTR